LKNGIIGAFKVLDHWILSQRLLTCTTAGSRQKHMEEGDEEWLEEKAHYIRPIFNRPVNI
jgi:hypothetical protein